MGFQFVKKVENSANFAVLSINAIDKIAAEFWEVEFDQYSYAAPKGYDLVNWFDVLGHAIEYLGKAESFSWNSIGKNECDQSIFDMGNVACSILERYANPRYGVDEFNRSVEALTPFTNLCFHLKEQGIYSVCC
jgi:hypothetical protein